MEHSGPRHRIAQAGPRSAPSYTRVEPLQHELLTLQRTIGNQAVSQLLNRTNAGPPIQRLAILDWINKNVRRKKKAAEPTEDTKLVDTKTPPEWRPADRIFVVQGMEYKLPDTESLFAGGGMGELFHLKPMREGGPKLAIKLPRAAVQTDPDALAAESAAIRSEAEMASQVGDQPGFAKSFGTMELASHPQFPHSQPQSAMIFELLEGGDLKQWVGAPGHLARAYQKSVISYSEYMGTMQYIERSVLEGLQHLHALGYVHMDIKPANLMFDGAYNVKIIDLGGATSKTATGVNPPHSAAWSSPEFKALDTGPDADTSAAVTPGYDVYSTGLMSKQAVANLFAEVKPTQQIAELEKKYEAELKQYGAPTRATEQKLRRLRKFAGKQAHTGAPATTEASDFVGGATAAKPTARSNVDELLAHAHLADPLIEGDEARGVLTFVAAWIHDPTVKRAESAREVVPKKRRIKMPFGGGKQPKLPFGPAELMAGRLTLKQLESAEVHAELPTDLAAEYAANHDGEDDQPAETKGVVT